MNKYWWLLVGVMMTALGTASPVSAEPMTNGLVARIHFAGGNAVAANPNYFPVRSIWSSADALAMRAETLNKLDRFLDVWLRQQIAPSIASPLQMRPLLANLFDSEWQLDLYQPSGDAAEFTLAVRLDPVQAIAWQATLAPVVDSWKKMSAAHRGQVVASGNWVFLQFGNSPVPAPASPIRGLQGKWLTADVDWSRLASWFPDVHKFDPPQTHVEVTGRDGKVEVTGELTLAQPLPPLGKWQFPTNTIHSPFISFTAVRGISDWLKQQPWVSSLGISPLPDQLYTWVLPNLPYQTFAAVPLPSAPAALPKIRPVAEASLSSVNSNSPFKNFSITASDDQLSLIGAPLVVPYVQAIHESSGEFLLGGFFPNVPRGEPAPPQLFARLNEPGLVYYHWEITSERMKLFPQLYQLLFVVSRHNQLDESSAAGKWVYGMVTNLGPTVTTAREISPTELSFSRKAPAGLTAVKLVALASWLQSPDFPGDDIRMPPPKHHVRRPAAAGSSSANPPPFTLHH